MVGAAGDKGDGRGLCGQGSVFADFMRSCWLSEGRGRPRRPCPRLLHSEPSRLAVVTAFSLKLAAVSAGVEGGSEGSAVSVADSEHSEHSEDSAGAGVALSMVGAGVGEAVVGGGASARIWAR